MSHSFVSMKSQHPRAGMYREDSSAMDSARGAFPNGAT
jgi:hypothetical protein